MSSHTPRQGLNYHRPMFKQQDRSVRVSFDQIMAMLTARVVLSVNNIGDGGRPQIDCNHVAGEMEKPEEIKWDYDGFIGADTGTTEYGIDYEIDR